MRAVLDYCTGGTQRDVPAGTIVLHEGGTTGQRVAEYRPPQPFQSYRQNE